MKMLFSTSSPGADEKSHSLVFQPLLTFSPLRSPRYPTTLTFFTECFCRDFQDKGHRVPCNFAGTHWRAALSPGALSKTLLLLSYKYLSWGWERHSSYMSSLLLQRTWVRLLMPTLCRSQPPINSTLEVSGISGTCRLLHLYAHNHIQIHIIKK